MGLISNVVASNPVTATWGNAIRDASVMQVTAAERASITAVEGQLVYVSDEDRFYVYNGSAWVRVGWGATTTGRTGCAVKRTANQSIASSATRAEISFDGEDFDSDGFFTATSTDITIPTGLGGIYAVQFQVTWASSPGTSALTRARIIPNGATSYNVIDGDASVYQVYNYGGTNVVTGGSGTWVFGAGDKITLTVAQGSGGAINVTATMSIYRIGV
jgi:hypothetical protein